MGGACAWTGGMGWLVSMTPPAQRGTTIGNAMSAALAGVLLGTGARRDGASRRAGGAVLGRGVVAALLAVVALRMPGWFRGRSGDCGAPVRDGVARGARAPGAWLVLVPALVFGTVEVLVPLASTTSARAGWRSARRSWWRRASRASRRCSRAARRIGSAAGRRSASGSTGSLAFLLLVPLPEAAWPLALLVVAGCVLSGIVNTPR